MRKVRVGCCSFTVHAILVPNPFLLEAVGQRSYEVNKKRKVLDSKPSSFHKKRHLQDSNSTSPDMHAYNNFFGESGHDKVHLPQYGKVELAIYWEYLVKY